jgi:hypothetical protein
VSRAILGERETTLGLFRFGHEWINDRVYDWLVCLFWLGPLLLLLPLPNRKSFAPDEFLKRVKNVHQGFIPSQRSTTSGGTTIFGFPSSLMMIWFASVHLFVV